MNPPAHSLPTGTPDERIARAARLRERHRALLAERNLRQRDAAAELGVSEGELVAARVGADVTRLHAGADGHFIGLFEQLGALGRVMVLTRNAAAVHEKDGAFTNLSHEGRVGLALGTEIDLRMFYAHWAHAYAVTDTSPRGTLRSLQFYDACGEAVHKVYLREHSEHAAYDRLVAQWRAEDQSAGDAMPSRPAPDTPRPDSAIDVPALLSAWEAMTDTHQFFGLLKAHEVARTQALRLAEGRFTQAVAPTALRTVLEDAASAGLPIMVFVGNRGMVQIHTGPITSVRLLDSWVNVLDPGFNLHVRADLIDRAWVVCKPTSDGVVTSLELFDAQGETIAMLFGARKPGEPERPAWREVVRRLLGHRSACLPLGPATEASA
ncbi:hemin-degrading factor [Ralstonia solanacearum]|uniref:hemin-degrading factor n=1 Tax=Ralstonia solanacearum TaxID=305 RepID=UPI00078D28E3|nr:ChuX/HutX family heme-like substrate-binding protein [Ralstonia solanacearum]AMP39375.1 heme ABC transporter [Ralstonia solanacearum]AXV88210.1 hemin-degrading factor [Ralstonia solanacearum]AXW07691.1 hemin-degrading factor [Ralstonia solanacearum]AXW25484.1 hemin-degrading factor [Ralstonia solanacearum]AXW82396.1 hemin-degrading factor [Ralstonia solanacearum]